MDCEFGINSKIKVIDKNSEYFRWRGTLVDAKKDENDKYILTGEVFCNLHDDNNHHVKVWIDSSCIACIQKKFIDIEHIREDDIDLGNGLIRRSNIDAFEAGDIIVIQEKIDGANASIAWNDDEGKLEIFSRTNLLNGTDGLRGFKSYIETKFADKDFSKYGNLVIFGEWCVSHACKYDKDWYNVWRVYDIWDKNTRSYVSQDFVRAFCDLFGFEYTHVLYEGPFISWDHCRSFMDKKSYGPEQEGIVVKNQTKLSNSEVRSAKYLKIVNDKFKESITHKGHKREVDPEQQRAENEARELMKTVITDARVRKMIHKLVDTDILQEELDPKCMGIVAKHLPKMIYEDILKEESEVATKVGEFLGKLCSGITMEIAKKIIIGK